MKKIPVVCVPVLGLISSGDITRADFYVIPASGRVGTEVKALPFTISSPGFYFITRNLTSPGNGIFVNSDHVNIDLMGFSIIGQWMPGYLRRPVLRGLLRAANHETLFSGSWSLPIWMLFALTVSARTRDAGN